jgi:hypothetical protein
LYLGTATADVLRGSGYRAVEIARWREHEAVRAGLCFVADVAGDSRLIGADDSAMTSWQGCAFAAII